MKLPSELVVVAGASICVLMGWVEVRAFGLAILPLVYVVSALLGGATGVWWFYVGSRR